MHRLPAPFHTILACLMAGLSPGAVLALELNTATQRQLEQLDGIGATLARRIVDERRRHGDFHHWDDLRHRVRGISQDKAGHWSEQGLTVSGDYLPRVFVAKVPAEPGEATQEKRPRRSNAKAKTKTP